MTRLFQGQIQSPAIANGGTVSTVVDLRGFESAGVALPAAFTGVALTFQVSVDKTTFQVLADATNAAVSLVVAQGRSYQLPAAVLAWPYVKIVSGSAEAAARTLQVIGKG